MAGSIKGITIQIGADTTKLSSALNSANKSIKATQSQLTAVNKALKLDPTNMNLLRDKSSLLKDKIAETTDKLEALQKAQAQLDASGVDKNSKEYKELQTQIDLCQADLNQLNNEAKDFGSAGAQAIAAVGEKMKSLGSKIADAGQQLTTKVTVPLTALGTVAATKFADVDKTMQLTNATMGNTAEQADLLNTAMENAAANSTFGMSDAATATLNFARAGLSAEQAAAALAPAMNLAAGEGGDLDTVSAGLTATINGFGDSFESAEKYADIFANACNNTALDVDSLSSSMSVAAPIFSAAGYSVNDAALYMGVMANAGIDASTAANALKTGMARLVAPAADGQTWMNKLGISITNADGSMKDSVTVQKELHSAFSTLSESEQLAAASAIFGKNQMSNWLALINTAPDEVDSLNKSLEAEGTTTDMANAMMSGFGGSIEKLKSSVDVAATSLGEALAPTILKVSDAIQKAVDWFNSLSDEQKETIAKIGLVVAAIGPLLIIVGKVISLVGSIMTLAPALGTALAVLTGPVGLVVAAVAAAIAIGVLLYKNWDTIKAKAKELGENIKKKFNEIKESIVNAITGAKDAVVKKWDEIKSKMANSALGQTAAKVWDAVKTTTTTSLSSIKAAYDSHGGGMKGAVAATMEGIKQYYTAGYNFINNLTGGKLSSMLNDTKAKMSEMVNTASTKLESIKSYFSSKLSDASLTVSSKLASIKGFFDGDLGSMVTTVQNKMEAVRAAFSEKINAAHQVVKDVIQKIKSLFDIQLKLDIKLPHVSVNGGEAPYGIGGRGRLPSFNVDWYDKGGIFSSPTIIGVGEKRPEFVGALDDLRQIVREESGVGGAELIKTMNTMVSLMSQLVEKGSRDIVVNQTINASETSYYQQQKQAARQFKEIARLI